MSEINCSNEKGEVSVSRKDKESMDILKTGYLVLRELLFINLKKLGLEFKEPKETDYQKHLVIDFKKKEIMDDERRKSVMSEVQKLINEFNEKVKSYQEDNIVDGARVKKQRRSIRLKQQQKKSLSKKSKKRK